MKLWLISQDVNDGYDTYDAAVVAAECEEDARMINPDGKWGPRRATCWAREPHQVEVALLGVAEEGTEAGIVLSSFNAG